MTNIQIAALFEELGDLLEILGENPFRIRSFRNAARSIADWTRSIEEMVEGDADLTKIPGIGKGGVERIREIVATGTCETLEEARAKVPVGVREFLRIEGVGPKKAGLFHRELGIDSLDALEAAAKAGKLRDLPGMGEKSEEKLLRAIANARKGEGRFLLSVGIEQAERLVEALRGIEGVRRIEPAGSVRRWRETVGDIDIIVAGDPESPVLDAFTGHGDVAEIIARGPTKSSVRMRSGLQADLRLVEEASFGAALAYFTGSKAHNIAIRERARARGLKVSEYAVEEVESGRRIGGAKEEEVFASVGLPWIPPELREDRGEIEAAEAKKLPRLVDLDDIRGDLQMHTKASDGRNTILEMAEKAKSLGYEYILITDHSKAVRVANGLDEERLLEHCRAIDRANDRIDGIRILKGIEVDILPDGSLDLRDDALAACDVVVASVHFRFSMPEDEMTDRIARAISRHRVHILGHPTGRLILQREPYAVDLARIFEVARDAGVAMEINAHPDRLDLRDVDARAAKEAGLRIAISTDAHAREQLELMRFGVHTARRAWLEKKDVLNALSFDAFRKALRD
ncbi:MAG: DNA polymerase/3'-5' exonuclease PolX [Planctomycetes bacterium]|nr:DNA polymerase/3'-5' exonuclease PolX [Planctomycetota bacterium]